MQSPAQRDSDLYSRELDWFLTVAPSQLGQSGTLGSMISILEHGGYPTGVPNTDLADVDVGWCCGDDPSEKWRKLAPAWFLLAAETQLILCAHYSQRAPDVPENARVAVVGELGKIAMASLVVLEGEQLAKFLTACLDKGKGGRTATIAAAKKRTDIAVRAAHTAWVTYRELLGDDGWQRFVEIRMAERLARYENQGDAALREMEIREKLRKLDAERALDRLARAETPLPVAEEAVNIQEPVREAS